MVNQRWFVVAAAVLGGVALVGCKSDETGMESTGDYSSTRSAQTAGARSDSTYRAASGTGVNRGTQGDYSSKSGQYDRSSNTGGGSGNDMNSGTSERTVTPPRGTSDAPGSSGSSGVAGGTGSSSGSEGSGGTGASVSH